MASNQGQQAPSVPILSQLFGLDLRSLAAFRVTVALVVLADLAVRAEDLTAFYTDRGVLPRAELLRSFDWLHEWPLCVHLLGGAWWSQVLVFSVAAAFALALLVGYRTRLAIIVVWLLTASVQWRNLYIGHGSDAQLRMMLFWACFLPLGARYSVDSALRWSAPPREQQQYLSVGTIAFATQIVIIYLSTAWAKSLYPWWRDGTAVAYVFDNEIWGTYVGHFLLQFPLLCTLLTYLTLILEFAGPALLFVPILFGPLRTATLFALAAMHLGFAVGMRVGVFPFTSIAALLGLLPAWFWDRLLDHLRTQERTGVQITFHDDCARCSRVLTIFRTFFLLPETTIRGIASRAQNAPPPDALWMLTDHTGRQRIDSDALVGLCRVSPLLWPVAWSLELQPVRALRDFAWKRFAAHAPAGPTLLASLRPRPVVRRQRLAETVCAVFLAYVVFWNVGVLRDSAYVAPPSIAWLGSTFFLQQDWRMYSRVATRTGWITIPGKLEDGTEIDLFRLGGPVADLRLHPEGAGVSFERPESVVYRVKNYRWLGMMDRLIHYKRGEQQLLLYGRYLCREWNAHHTGEKQLETLEIIFMARDVVPAARAHRTEEYDKEVLWRHWCFQPPAGLS
jgi:hypothetical protein